MTKIGVREFKTPARELSITSSAIQNKYAGNKLPKTPERKMYTIFETGIFPNTLMVVGSNTRPEVMILMEAT